MLTLHTEPQDWPVTLDELKDHLAIIDDVSQDERLEALLDAATAFVEAETGRALVDQTWTLTLDAFPCLYLPYKLYLPKPPLLDIESVSYYDENNTLQTYTDYYMMTPATGQGWIEPVTTYPGTYTRPDAVQITFSCGYETVPPQAKQAIKLLCGAWNENREAIGNLTSEIALGVKALLNQLNPGVYQ